MQKKYHKNDLRVKRTHTLVFDALIELTIQKGFAAITVSDITAYAGINRATFYRHYKDKFDMLNQYVQDLYEMMETQRLSTLHTIPTFDYQVPVSLVKIFAHIRENARFYRVMLGEKGDPAFTEKIRNYIQKRIRSSLPTKLKIDETLIDLFVSYSASASFGAILWWLEHNMPYSAEEMIKILSKLESENLRALLA